MPNTAPAPPGHRQSFALVGASGRFTMTMQQINPSEYIHTPEHTGGLQEVIEHPLFTSIVEEFPDRIGIVAAHHALELIEEHGIDHATARNLALTTVFGMLRATAIEQPEIEVAAEKACDTLIACATGKTTGD